MYAWVIHLYINTKRVINFFKIVLLKNKIWTIIDVKKKKLWDFTGGPVVKTLLPLQGVEVQFLVRD